LLFEKWLNMGRAIEMGQREQLIALKAQGYSLWAISEQLLIPYGTVCQLSARLGRLGHLRVGYANCGPKQPGTDPLLLRSALWLKRHHPSWGAPFIRVHLTAHFANDRIPSASTLQRWFRKRHLSKPRQVVAPPRIGCAKAPHNIWQVDAKENLILLDGSEACYLTITDEHSGAGLEALVFPPQADRTSAFGRSASTAY
jgi:hypothetical protein